MMSKSYNVKVLCAIDILSSTKEDYLRLLEHAETARKNAYSPYSKFEVGAALLTNNKQVYCGSNIENASYGLTVCAERSAIFSAISQGISPNAIEAIAISAIGEQFSPCGACRQVIFEFGENIVVIFKFNDGIIIDTINNLLPYSFRSR
jgi:cytidine deaminase